MSVLSGLRRRWPRVLVITLVLIPLLLIGVALALLGTRDGNLWLLQRAAPFIPGELRVDGWHGSLLTGLRVKHLDYRLDALYVSVSNLVLDLDAGDLIGGRVHLERLGADTVSVTPPPSSPQPRDNGPFQLPESLTLPLGVRIDALDVAQVVLRGESPLRIDGIVGSDLAAWKRFRFRRLALSVADTHVDGTLQGRLAKPYRLNGTLAWQQPGPADAIPDMQGILYLDGNAERLNVTHTLSLPVQVVSTGSLDYRDGQLHLDLTHRWPAQTLPVETPVPVKLGDGELTTAGTLDALTLRGQANLTADGQPLRIDLNGQASTRDLKLDTLTLTSNKQTLALSGRLGYQQGLAWHVQARGRHLDPSILAPDWPGKLALDAASEGHWKSADDWALTVKPLSLTGTLKNAAVKLDGQAGQSSGQRVAVRLTGQWGKDRLSAKGTLGDTLNLDGTLALASLNRWHPQARGHLKLDWQARGPLATPSLSGRLDGGDLAWRDWQLSRLQARFDKLSLGQGSMSLSLQGEGLNQGDAERAERIALDAKGTRARHTLTLSAQRQQARTTLTLDAGLDPQNRWRGQLRQWTLSQPDLGTWRLRQPAAFTVSPARQRLERFCLAPDQGQGELCLGGDHQGSKLDGQLTLRQLPLALANPWLGGELSLAGQANADARFQGTVSHPAGQWNLKVDGGRVTITGTDTRQTLTLGQAELHGHLDGERLHNRLDLVVANQGELHAEVENGLAADTPLRGEVSLSIPKLDDLAPLIPRVNEVKGRVQGRLKLSGTLAKPGASGKLTLDGGEATVPELGITVTAIQLAVAGDPDGLDLQGQAGFGDRTLHLQGRWDPARSPLAVNLTVRGERLLVANRSDAKVYVSPDLTLQGDPDGLHLSGDVKVPEADLQPRQLPESAVTVSKDQVLVDARAQQQSAVPLSMAVTVTLGDKVHFQGFGLDATLGGELKVTQKAGEPAQLYGDLIIKQGRYKAYGQNLAIDNGRLLFQGPPDDPGLDIRAIRKIPSENQVVGVQLSGTLQQPQARIFSNPELEESQAMSYLLTGHSLNQGSQGDSAKVAQALALYGLQKGQGVTQKIGDTLGLDEITIGSDWGGTEDAALMLGKQLSDRLFLTYAVGLFDAVSTVMLRYTLTRTLHLEAQSSTKSQAIDLIWEKELR